MRRPPGERGGTRVELRLPSAYFRALLEEDRWRADRTSQAVVPRGLVARAEIVAERPGRLSGLGAARRLAHAAGLRAVGRLRDGDPVRRGDKVLQLSGPARRILAAERTILNLMMHLSGVATATSLAVREAHRRAPGFKILATRKTLPGLRDLEKQAVVDGGGLPHRRDLSSAILIKNTHLTWVPVVEAVRRARAKAGGRPVQVEVRAADDARAAVAAGARQLLIDNQSPRVVRRVVLGLGLARAGVFVEVSGGITLRNVGRFAATGADGASLGALTHSAPALPFHLRWVP